MRIPRNFLKRLRNISYKRLEENDSLGSMWWIHKFTPYKDAFLSLHYWYGFWLWAFVHLFASVAIEIKLDGILFSGFWSLLLPAQDLKSFHSWISDNAGFALRYQPCLGLKFLHLEHPRPHQHLTSFAEPIRAHSIALPGLIDHILLGFKVMLTSLDFLVTE